MRCCACEHLLKVHHDRDEKRCRWHLRRGNGKVDAQGHEALAVSDGLPSTALKSISRRADFTPVHHDPIPETRMDANYPDTEATRQTRSAHDFELRFVSLFNPGRGLSFPCDASGRVDVEGLSERARQNLLLARNAVGRDYCVPQVLPAA
jgi:hypothetical protein